MVNVIWILENIKKHPSFYTELKVNLLLTSAIQWKKHNPNTNTVLYCDKMTYSFLSDISAIDIWDYVFRVPFNQEIDKNVFWASSKLEVLSGITSPSVVLDHDFIVYKSFETYLKGNVIVGHAEDGESYYPSVMDEYVKRTRHILNRPNNNSVNCCFNYYPNPSFARSYANTSLELMKELTKLKAPNSNYLVYAEQLLLKHVLDLHNIEYECLIPDIWHCNDRRWIKGTKGLIDTAEIPLSFRHYWMDKPKIVGSSDGFSYIDEIEPLRRVISNNSNVDIQVLTKLNKG